MPKTKYYIFPGVEFLQYQKFQQSSWSLSYFIFQACDTGCLAGRCWPLDHLTLQAANTPNKSSPEMDTAQVTLLTCYYVQQYYQPNHQESIGEKEKCEVGVDELICVSNRLLAERLLLYSHRFHGFHGFGWRVCFFFFRQVVALGCIFIACKVEGSWNDSTSTGWLKKKVLRKKVAHDRYLIISVCNLVVCGLQQGQLVYFVRFILGLPRKLEIDPEHVVAWGEALPIQQG